jgi:hypothetical protein
MFKCIRHCQKSESSDMQNAYMVVIHNLTEWQRIFMVTGWNPNKNSTISLQGISSGVTQVIWVRLLINLRLNEHYSVSYTLHYSGQHLEGSRLFVHYVVPLSINELSQDQIISGTMQ